MSQQDSTPSPEMQALAALRKMRAKLEALERQRAEPLAIIGIGCRLPGGVTDPESYWDLLQNGRHAVRKVPPDRWDPDKYFDPDPKAPGKTYTCWGGFLDGIDQFDAPFFGIAAAEARRMSPPQRLFLEVAWEALEAAGISPKSLRGTRTGVFVGATTNDYLQLQTKVQTEEDIDAYVLTNNTLNVIAGRVSYTLGLQGPSMAIDTACSSSLVAIDRALRSLREGETDLVIAGGVNVNITPDTYISAAKWGMLAHDGRCKAFDAGADGFVRGEGCGVLVIRRLSDAQAAGDRILAVIRGTAVNQDGPSSGLSVPNGLAQEAVIREALANAGVEPEQVSYVEAHGTGTSLGDPIEVEALGRALAERGKRTVPLLIGSVKTNLGHLEAASGVTGLIKVVLSLLHRAIPPHLHLQKPSEHIAWERYAIEVPTQLRRWEPINGRRIAGVSSFGFSGTNAHVVLEEAPAAAVAEAGLERPYHLLTISAKTAGGLRTQVEAYRARLQGKDEDRLADLCYTANLGRAHFGQRLIVGGQTRAEIAAKLGTGEGVVRGEVDAQQKPRVAMLFTGQGSQYSGMGRELYETSPLFRGILERCDELLRGKLPRGLLEVMFGTEEGLLEQTGYTQPALFALEYGLAELWRSWGVQATAVLGHSVGEYVAACVAGVFSLEEGLGLIAERGRIMQAEPPGGAMAAVFASEERVRAAVAGHESVSVAAVNGPGNVVISGDAPEVEVIREQLAAAGLKSQPLRVSHAFHSRRMDPVLERLEAAAGRVRIEAPRLRLISNVNGKAAGAEVTRPGYWAQHTRAAVQFARGMETLRELGCEVMLEVGPAPVLTRMGQECLGQEGRLWVGSLHKGKGEWQQMSAGVQALYAAGVEIDWAGWDGGYGRRKVSMPTYRFQRQRYWIETGKTPRAEKAYVHPLLGVERATPLVAQQFDAELSPERPAWIQDYRIAGRVVLPATAYVEMGLAAGRKLWPGDGCAVEDLALPEALVFDGAEARSVTTVVETQGEDEARWRVYSANGQAGKWTLHASGCLRRSAGTDRTGVSESPDVVRLRCGDPIEGQQFYAALNSESGEYFRGVRRLWKTEGQAIADIRLPERAATEAVQYSLHPALLNAALEAAGVFLDSVKTWAPVGIESICLDSLSPAALYCHAVPKRIGDESCSVDIAFYSKAGKRVGEAVGIQFKPVDAPRFPPEATIEDLYEIDWRPAIRQPGAEKPPKDGRWLILADQSGTGRALATALESQGQQCVMVPPESIPGSLEQMRQVVHDAMADGALHGVVYLAGIDAPDPRQMTTEALTAFERRACRPVLHTVQAIAAERPLYVPRLWLVTRGAQGEISGAGPSGLAGASILGLGKAIAIEHPELRCARIDLDPAEHADEVQLLFEEIWCPDREDQVAFRERTRFTPRLARRTAPIRPAGSGADDQQLQLEIQQPSLLESLKLRSVARRAPGPGEVEIRVRAMGLNFRDVLTALGMYPSSDLALGGECAGVIERVGAGVENWKPGDEVMALSPGSFGTFAVTRAQFLARKPAGMGWAEAASVPVAFLTAAYGFGHLAKLVKGQSILIHAAAGGVGLAAVQLARLAGAEVYATAGSEEKRGYLRSLGVRQVMDSRSLEFVHQTRESTGGRGVDVVLNSLAGDFIREGLAIVARGGCFLELGKRGILRPDEAASLRPDVRYHACDLNGAFFEQPDLVQALFGALMPAFESGTLHPLPVTTFKLDAAAQAFQYMAKARHIGKIVLLPPRTAPAIREGTYLITGGLGELGLQAARWLAAHGARHLVLVSRSAPTGPQLEAVEELRRSADKVSCLAGDVSSPDETSKILERISDSMPPLRGIVHAAGVVDNHTLATLDWDACARVFAAKVLGAWNLHQQTLGCELDFFVLFSSAAVVLGASGQANYVAANTFLDSLAHYRHAQGLPAMAVDWGCWAGGGDSQLGKDTAARLAALGMTPLAPAEALNAFERLLGGELPHAAFMRLNWQTFLRTPYDSPFFDDVRPRNAPVQAPTDGLLQRLKKTAAAQRRPMLVEHISRCAVQVLGLGAGYRIDELQPLRELGADSLLSVELRNRLGETVSRPLPATLLFDYPTISSLAAYLAGVLGLAGEPAPEVRRPDKAVAAVAAMTDAEAEAMLLQELSGEGGRSGNE
jgi:acyl transferase domain-containing protein/acyl carrier protein